MRPLELRSNTICSGFAGAILSVVALLATPVAAQLQGPSAGDAGILDDPSLGDRPLGDVDVQPISVPSTIAVQDHSGFMWFGASDGLRRFDGYEYTVFQHNPEDSTSLSVNRMETLYITSDGTLWVGTFGGGLNRFNEETETFTRFFHDPNVPGSLSQDTVTAILEDRDGVLWVGTHGGLNQFDPSTGKFRLFTNRPDDPTSLSNDQVRVLYEDRMGTLWVGTGSPAIIETPAGEGGLNRFDRASQTFTRFMHDPDDESTLITNQVMTLFEDSRGTFWVGTTGDGLHTMDRDAGTFTRLRHDPSDPSKLSAPLAPGNSPAPVGCDIGFDCHGVSIIHEDQSGVLWFGSLYEGMTRFDPESGVVSRVDLPQASVWNFTESHDGTLWLSTWDGAFRLVSAANDFPLVVPTIPGEIYTDDNVFVGSFFLNADDDLWMGAAGRGIMRFNAATGAFLPWMPEEAPAHEISGFATVDIFRDGKGVFWLAQYDPLQLGRFDPSSGEARRIQHDPADPVSLANYPVLNFAQDSLGRIWASTAGSGVVVLDQVTGTVIHHIYYSPRQSDGLVDGFALVVREDRAGSIWVGTNNGLNKIISDPQAGPVRVQAFLPGTAVTVIHEDQLGRFWVGTLGDGLFLLDRETGDLKRYGRQEGLATNNVVSLVEDEVGDFWIATNDGGTIASPFGGHLSRFEIEQEAFTNFDRQSGVPEIGFFLNCAIRDSEGVLYFGGVGGFTFFHPTALREPSQQPPKMAFTHLRVFNEDIEPGQDGLLSVPMHLTERLVLDHDQNDFTIDYTALSFRDPDNLSYSYRLDPLDKDWVRARNHRSARYSGLQPDEYTFRVKAVDSRGVVSLDEASMAVIVLPPWWKTIWAYCLYAILFVGAIVAFDRFQRRRIVRKEREKARETELKQAKEIEQAYNQLREAKDRMVQQEKLASLGQLTAGIAHEIKNPLNFVTNFASINSELADEIEQDLSGHPEALKEVKDLLADLKKNAAVIAQHGGRADSIVRSMMQHASGGSSNREPADINNLVNEFVGLAYHGMRARHPDFNCELELELAEGLGDVPLVSQDFGRVLVNLLGNAFDALYEKQQENRESFAPRVTVKTRSLEDEVEIRIADNGDGVPDEVKERIFEPFFTTKPTGSGTGLGLSLSHEIITQGHGGSLTLDNAIGTGATFVIRLPRD